MSYNWKGRVRTIACFSKQESTFPYPSICLAWRRVQKQREVLFEVKLVLLFDSSAVCVCPCMFHISKPLTSFQLTCRDFWPTSPDPCSSLQTCCWKERVRRLLSQPSGHTCSVEKWSCVIQSTCAFLKIKKKKRKEKGCKGHRAVISRGCGIIPRQNYPC